MQGARHDRMLIGAFVDFDCFFLPWAWVGMGRRLPYVTKSKKSSTLEMRGSVRSPCVSVLVVCYLGSLALGKRDIYLKANPVGEIMHWLGDTISLRLQVRTSLREGFSFVRGRGRSDTGALGCGHVSQYVSLFRQSPVCMPPFGGVVRIGCSAVFKGVAWRSRPMRSECMHV